MYSGHFMNKLHDSWRERLYINIIQRESSISLVRSDATNSYRPVIEAERCEVRHAKQFFGVDSTFGRRVVVNLDNLSKELGFNLPNNDQLRVIPCSIVLSGPYVAFFAEQVNIEPRIRTAGHTNFYYGAFSYSPLLLSYKIEPASILIRRAEGMRSLTRRVEKIIVRFPFLIVTYKVRDGFIFEVCDLNSRQVLFTSKIEKEAYGSVKNIFLMGDYLIIVTNTPNVVFCHKIIVDLNSSPQCQLVPQWKKINKRSILTHWGDGSISISHEQSCVILSCAKSGRIVAYDLDTGTKLGKIRLQGVRKILFGEGDKANIVVFIGNHKNSFGEVTGIEVRKKRIERVDESRIAKRNEGDFIFNDETCQVVGLKDQHPILKNIVDFQFFSKMDILLIGTKRMTFIVSLNENRRNRLMMKVKTYDPDDRAWLKTGYQKGDAPELLSVAVRDKGLLMISLYVKSDGMKEEDGNAVKELKIVAKTITFGEKRDVGATNSVTKSVWNGFTSYMGWSS
eukprot:TRINITY_DN26778_c0_g1_i1.p1 TRINITY_DN26778_c0_g1~~TRINITY_DN26778_c0_g1_i1.p1  ORF type:complete len:508 (-),score=63.33 TRINITY_DN26778_c0_g1_i1:113-1636(-)